MVTVVQCFLCVVVRVSHEVILVDKDDRDAASQHLFPTYLIPSQGLYTELVMIVDPLDVDCEVWWIMEQEVQNLSTLLHTPTLKG